MVMSSWKKGISLMIVTLMACVSVNVSFAEELTKDRDVDKILVNFGYPADIVKVIDETEKSNVAEMILTSPEDVKMNFSVTEIDEVASIQKVVNSSDHQLLEEGFNVDDIKKMRNHIKKFKEMSDAEVKAKYKKSAEEIKLLRKALKQKKDYNNKQKKGNIVTTSGTISSSKLTYSQTVYDNKYSTGKAVSYRAYSTFKWHSPYFWDIYDDEVVFGWGGNLATSDVRHHVYYQNDSVKYAWTKRETPINAGLEFTTPQSKGYLAGDYRQIESGYTGVTLYQNKKQGYDSKVLSAYGHKMLALAAGIGVSASGPSVSLSFSTGFDYSPQESSEITY